MAEPRGQLRIDVQPPSGQRLPTNRRGLIGLLSCLAIGFTLLVATGVCSPGTYVTTPQDSALATTPIPAHTSSFNVAAFVGFTQNRAATSADRQSDEPQVFSLLFAYDKVRVIVVKSLDEIPPNIRRSATFETRPRKGLIRTVTDDSTHIIQGDVDVTLGALWATDALSVGMAIQANQVRDLNLVLSQEPRGPPQLLVPASTVLWAAAGAGRGMSSRDLATSITAEPLRVVDNWPDPGPTRPTRVIYIVGDIRNFKGPAQYNSSRLQADIVDLGPRTTTAEGYLVDASKQGYDALYKNRNEPRLIEASDLRSAIGEDQLNHAYQAYADARPHTESRIDGPSTSRDSYRPAQDRPAEPHPASRPRYIPHPLPRRLP